MSYQAKADKAFRAGFSYLPEVPRSATLRHVLGGALDGRQLTAFQSGYTIYTGQVNVNVAYTIYTVACPDWPVTHVTPRNFVGRLAFKLGRRSGLMLENDEFNARFKVRDVDDEFAVTLLSPDMQAFMLDKTSVRWRIGRGRVCLIYSGSLRPRGIERSLQRMRGFWALVPPELEAW